MDIRIQVALIGLAGVLISGLITWYGYHKTDLNIQKELQNSLQKSIIEDKKRIYARAISYLDRLYQYGINEMAADQSVGEDKEDIYGELALLSNKEVFHLFAESNVIASKIYLQDYNDEDSYKFHESLTNLILKMKEDLRIEH